MNEQESLTIIIQTPGPGYQIGSVITYTDLPAAMHDYFHAILEGEPGTVVSLFYTHTPGEPALRVRPIARELPQRPCQLN